MSCTKTAALPVTPDDAFALITDPIIPAGRARGAFAAEASPPADATALQRLVAFSGRAPLQ